MLQVISSGEQLRALVAEHRLVVVVSGPPKDVKPGLDALAVLTDPVVKVASFDVRKVPGLGAQLAAEFPQMTLTQFPAWFFFDHGSLSETKVGRRRWEEVICEVWMGFKAVYELSRVSELTSSAELARAKTTHPFLLVQVFSRYDPASKALRCVMRQLSELASGFAFATVDADEHPEVAAGLGARGLYVFTGPVLRDFFKPTSVLGDVLLGLRTDFERVFDTGAPRPARPMKLFPAPG